MRLSQLAGAVAAGAIAVAPIGSQAAKPKHPATGPVAGAPAAGTPAAGAPAVDTVVAKVNGTPIHLSDLDAAVQELPQQLRSQPAAQLYPYLVDQLVDRQALVIAARKQNLQSDPAVQQAIARATDQQLQNALLRRDIGPQINDAALHAMYDKDVGSKPGEEQVKASHILVATEDQAKKIIAELNGGADFAAEAKKYSTDPSGSQNGGDLGYFKKGDMLPEFANAAFALKPGTITATPVKTRYGWHVIKVFDHRLAPPPTFSEAQPQLQQALVQRLIKAEVDKAKQGLTVQLFNSDGSPAAAGTPPAAVAPAAPPVAPGTAPAPVPAPAAPAKPK